MKTWMLLAAVVVVFPIKYVCAEPTPPATECSPLIENRTNCTSVVSTYPRLTGVPPATSATTPQIAYSPMAVRARPTVTVNVKIYKRPLEQVHIQETYNEQAKPDPFGTILGQLTKPLTGGLTIAMGTLTGLSHTGNPGQTAGFVPDRLHAPPTDPALLRDRDNLRRDYDAVVNQLESLGSDQKKAGDRLSDQNKILVDVSKEIGAAQRYAPTVQDDARGPDHWTDQETFDRCIDHLLIRLGEDIKPIVTGDLCEQGSPPSNPLRQLLIGSLPSVQIATLKPQIDGLPKALGKLEERVQTLFPRLKPSEQFTVDFSEVEERIDTLTDRQDLLADGLKAAQSARAALVAYRDVLDAWKLQERQAPQQMVVQSIPLTQHSVTAGTGSQKLDAKIQAQTLLTKESSDVGTVSVTWVKQRWEVSAGLMWSNVLGRSFQNAPTIVNGKPVLDSNGKQVTMVTESTTSPTVDAVVLIHYRITEWPALWNRRFAVLGTAGVGTGANGSGVDFATGASFAWGNLLVSPLLHFTRDTRLTNGIGVGTNLGPSPPSPSTEKYWVHKLGIAFTYAIPIT
jgi:hypothetical protein